MCGIAGVVNYEGIDLERIAHLLRHRGPDDQTIYTENQVALIQTRLAIQDIQNGVQPFHHGAYSIIFNGEIYNHQELRHKLTDFVFKTNSDTETLLYLFIKYGIDMFDMIDGMFAFCIFDKNKKKLFLARDRAGKKPLYFYPDKDSFIFSSELNAIKAIKNLTISHDAINSYLRTGFVWGSYTAYQNLFELASGSFLVLDIPTLHYEIQSYFNILDCYIEKNDKLNFNDSLVKLEALLIKSVNDRITASDVDVGVFLSGGIDSNLLAALASNVKQNIKTFTVRFDGLYNESPLAELTAKKYQTSHTVIDVSTDIKNDIEKILTSYGEPFMDSSAVPSYYVSREASKHVKVVLTGDGADELFAGYRRYIPVANGLTKYFKLLTPLLALLPNPKQKQSLYNYVYRLVAMANKKNLDFYLSATTDVFEDVISIKGSAITSELEQFVGGVFANRKLSDLSKMLYADFSILLFCDLLVKMDIASMANSLEVRSPFLSKYLLEFAPQMPDNYKINKLNSKHILRKLAQKYLSPELIHQPKRGFEVPLKSWVNNDLKQLITDALQPGCYSENFIDRKDLQKIINKDINVSAEKRAKMLWSFFCLEVWHRNEKKLCLPA